MPSFFIALMLLNGCFFFLRKEIFHFSLFSAFMPLPANFQVDVRKLNNTLWLISTPPKSSGWSFLCHLRQRLLTPPSSQQPLCRTQKKFQHFLRHFSAFSLESQQQAMSWSQRLPCHSEGKLRLFQPLRLSMIWCQKNVGISSLA